MAEQSKKMPVLSENAESSGAPAQPTPLEIVARENACVTPAEEEDHGHDVYVRIDRSLFHCATCPAPLKPPLFVCESGAHVLCSDCGDGGGSKHCGPCGVASTFSHSRSIDNFFESKALPCCPYCEIAVAYHAMAGHMAGCSSKPSAH